MQVKRRTFLRNCATLSLGLLGGRCAHARPVESPPTSRRYHVCSNTGALESDPGLLDLYLRSGADAVWLAGFFYGYWPYPPEQLRAWRERIRGRGIECEIVNIPLGHPGDSLGAPGGNVPLTPSESWRMAVRPDGSRYSGTSLHPPATESNVAAIKQLAAIGVERVFLDDDFRLATAPGVIGGCYCDDHKRAFLNEGAYGDTRWNELLADVQSRSLSPMLRAWVEYTCDQLTACFRAQQAAAPDVELGNMIMYFGAEKAGIRLKDYVGVPFRVGELMFSDASFAPIKGKTNELYSCLFHRRYASPELAFSETTAYPADRLSAANMAAKLAVSTIADVRNTMFMSGLTPIPNAHWDTLGPAMKKHAAIHAQLAGHRPRGPFKHYWGEASRYIGDDNPYSLFLATGVPFEVVHQPGEDGWTFLSEWDAKDVVRGTLKSKGTTLIARDAAGDDTVRVVPEALPALFALKHELADQLVGIPHVIDDKPVVCAWYPTAGRVLLWNLAEHRETFTVSSNGRKVRVTISALDVELVTLPVG